MAQHPFAECEAIPSPGEPGHRSGRGRRSPVLWALIGLALLFDLALLINGIQFMSTPRSGFSFYRPGYGDKLVGQPVTRAAAEAVEGMEPPLQVVAVNGQDTAAMPMFAFPYHESRYTDLAPGARNSFTVKDSAGVARVIQIPAGEPDGRVVLCSMLPALLFELFGLLYLAVGLMVWLRRPEDRAARPLLMMCLVAHMAMSANIIFQPLGLVLTAVEFAIMPLWGLTGFFLAVKFTGSMERRAVRKILRLATVVALSTSAAIAGTWLLSAFGVADLLGLFQSLLLVSGVVVLACVLGMMPLVWRASRHPNPLALRRRARVFGSAALASFLVPSVTLILLSLGLFPHWFLFVNLILLGLFPILIGYAIVRHQMFDLRIILRRGAVYALLTLVVSLAYVGLVLVGLRVARAVVASPLFIGLSVAGVVAVFSLLHFRVQRGVDRFVHRTRYVYGRALERASEALTHHRQLDAIGRTVRSALIDSMGLKRVYFLTMDDGELRCHEHGLHPRAELERRPVLPGCIHPLECAPIRRALETGRVVTTHDSVAVAAQSNGLSRPGSAPAHRCTEAGFWSYFGVEAIMPLTLGSRPGETRVVGLLVLGPKVTDRPLDSEDHAMLSTLANNAAVAVESCMAFEEIRRLNESLEQQVRERTSELSLALEELKAAQGRLVESEMQAVLGRLVAGILHEVNSPLGTLRSSLDTIERALARSQPVLERHPDAQAPDVRRARAAVETSVALSRVLYGSEARIREVLDSLRRFVSLDVAEVMPLDLAQSIRDVLTLLSIDERIRVHTELPEESLVIRCKPARINKVFLDLLQNAVNGIDGPGEIRVRVERLGERVAVTIEDTGRGIPAARLARIFDFGFTTKSGGRVGMRMGLPTSKRWVEEGGGQLTIDSAVGRGTTVRVELPTRPPELTSVELAVAGSASVIA